MRRHTTTPAALAAKLAAAGIKQKKTGPDAPAVSETKVPPKKGGRRG